MPNAWSLVDSHLPQVRMDGDLRGQILEILEFLNVLTESLKYQLENLDEDNLNGAALERMIPMTRDEEGNITIGAEGKELRLVGKISINGKIVE